MFAIAGMYANFDMADKTWDQNDEKAMENFALNLKIQPIVHKIIQKIRIQSQNVYEPNAEVLKVMNRVRYKSNSPEWFNVRGRLLTASDMAAVFGENPYQSSSSIFLKKTRQEKNPFRGNAATRWGQRYENDAAHVYQKLTGMPVIDEIGLVVHPYEKYNDLGRKRYAATPDRLAWNGVLIEIKCPFRRVIEHNIPIYYRAQLQCQMEVTGCDILHFVQYRPPTNMTKGVFDIVEVNRDPKWWSSHLSVLDSFWDRVINYYHKVGLEVGETYKKNSPKNPKDTKNTLKIRIGQPMEIVYSLPIALRKKPRRRRKPQRYLEEVLLKSENEFYFKEDHGITHDDLESDPI